ncbi:MAG: S8 family serine peptidase [Pseudomonadota bacterium]
MQKKIMFRFNFFTILTLMFFFCFVSLLQAKERSVIVGFYNKPGDQEESLLRRHGGGIKRKFRHLKAFSSTLSDQEMTKLRKDPKVKYVVEDTVYWSIEPVDASADPVEYLNSWGVEHIGSKAAHSRNITGEGVRVAVLDTGIDYTHPELAGNYQGGWDFVFDDNDPYDDSWNSHGTHVAGIIAAAPNGTGVVGVAPNAGLYGVKVLDGAGFGLLSWIIAGIDWAVDNNIDIVNISVGGPHTAALQDACKMAYEAGVLLVAAAGNGSTVAYPAAYDSVIAVTGTDKADQKGWFAPTGLQIELAAPGVIINSTTAGSAYAELSGTSQAAPHVSGVAALLVSAGVGDVNKDGVTNNLDVRQQLQKSAQDLGEAGQDNVFGFGLVNVEAALEHDGGDENHYLEFELIKERKRECRKDIISLSGDIYQISIGNKSLRGVNIVVFEEGSRRRYFSEMIHFSRNTSETVTFFLDAGDKSLDIVFWPLGKPGGSATITIDN